MYISTSTNCWGTSYFECFLANVIHSLVFAARQIVNNLSPRPIAKNFELLLLVLRIISLERTSNNLACALQFFLGLFCAAQNRSFKPKFNLKKSLN